MASASVLIPLATINMNGGTLPPSALVQHSPRHGRSRAASMKGNKGRYNVLENRDVAIAKAVSFVLKRAVRKSEVEESEEDEEKSDRLISDEEGWVAVTDLLNHNRISDLRATFPDIQRIEAEKSKARFALRRNGPSSGADLPASYQIRSTHKRDSLQAPILEGEPLTVANAADLPEFVVYETSYEAYPHILASGSIQRAAGATHISFSPVTVGADGSSSESRLGRSGAGSDADIGIWVHLRTALETEPSIVWQRSTSGALVTANEVPKSLWKKAVARRPDVGLLFEDGEIRKEVPERLRGKGSKGKAKNKMGKGSLKSRGEDASESASASEE